MKKYLIIMGAPGSGKDTQGKRISEKQKIPLISSGDALRDEIANGTPIGKKFQELIAKGLLVPDEVMFEFIDNLLSKYDLSRGFIFNGFPRTIPQAEFINCYLNKRNIEIDAALYLNVSDEEILRRISGRRICKNCGSVFNLYYSKPNIDGKCNNCGGELYQREDDFEDSVLKRISVYKESTLPLIDYFSKKKILIEIDGNGAFEKIMERILEAIND